MPEPIKEGYITLALLGDVKLSVPIHQMDIETDGVYPRIPDGYRHVTNLTTKHSDKGIREFLNSWWSSSSAPWINIANLIIVPRNPRFSPQIKWSVLERIPYNTNVNSFPKPKDSYGKVG